MNEGDQKRGWPTQFGLLRPPTSVSVPVTVIILVIFVTCIIIALLALGWLLADLVSGDQKRSSDAAKTALPILAGAIGLPLIIWRLVILDRQTRISEEKTQIDRETHYTSIFSRSIDQLGQTRELKSSKVGSVGLETIARTVPNIEVRLGGIHSLVRLAEESRRDRAKIESTLLAYVRENSWFDRDGEKSNRPSTSIPDFSAISLFVRRGPVSSRVLESYNKWIANLAKAIEAYKGLGKSFVETRVDVNEAIDAACITDASDRKNPARFFECLFVGRQFSVEQLAHSRFERCVFVDCTFSLIEIKDLSINNCTLYKCRIAITRSEITFHACRIIEMFFDTTSSKATFNHCRIANLTTSHNSEISIFSFWGGFLRTALMDLGGLVVTVQLTLFSECNFDGVKFVEGSKFDRCAFPDSSFIEADLSTIEFEYPESLSETKGNENTKLSKDTTRPSTWPAFLETNSTTNTDTSNDPIH
jgi:uncharacterized protein YjbI with pentapeptide repeats